ncbi:MAG: type II toxin-antitoxin system MqsR family toxin [Rugosibacter sp.]|nr:type II toxin-antitoxin system MqsR family toxin [Rugosibacter sp.]
MPSAAASVLISPVGLHVVLQNRTIQKLTTNADHRIWQNAYRPTTPAGEVYLKLTVIDEVLIVSFKEL